MAVNGLTPVPVESFAGLDWSDDADNLGWGRAIDGINADLDPRGALRPRPSATQWFATAVGTSPNKLLAFFTATGNVQWLVGDGGTKVNAYDAGGTLLGTATFASSGAFGMQAIGNPNGTRVYVGNGHDPIGYWNSNTNTWVINSTMATLDGVTGKAMPTGNLLAATPWDNRLAVAGFATGLTTGGPGGSQSSLSHVWFSEPANPTATTLPTDVTDWKANNYVILTPGDGEPITSMTVWNNQLFVFKKSKFFVFYGVSSDATGKPIFNYRTVSGVGVSGPGNSLAAAGPDGVYFVHDSGVYRTSGGQATRISDALRGVFPPYGYGVDNYHAPNAGSSLATIFPIGGVYAVAWYKGRLYIAFDNVPGSQNGVLVWDQALNAWMVWDTPVGAFATVNELLYFTKGATGVHYFARGTESMTVTYQSGFWNLDQPAREKTIRETQVIGQNQNGLDLRLGWEREPSAPGTGVAPSTYSVQSGAGRLYQRQAQFGESLSFRLSCTGTQGPYSWVVQRLVPMIRESVQGKAS